MAVFFNGVGGGGNSTNQKILVDSYTTAGSYTWSAPQAGKYMALIIGGGASGASVLNEWRINTFTVNNWGGSSGSVNLSYFTATKNQNFSLTVGAGGARTTAYSASSYYDGNSHAGVITDGNDGNDSIFNGITALKGLKGGTGPYGSYPTRSAPCETYIVPPSDTTFSNPFDLPSGMSVIYNDSQYKEHRFFDAYHFTDNNNIPVSYLIGGNGAAYGGGNVSGGVTLPNGKKALCGMYNNYGNGVSNNGTYTCAETTDPGSGGGANVVQTYGTTVAKVRLYSSKGADGGVFIWYLGP